jgi:serine/threonine-protein kinase
MSAPTTDPLIGRQVRDLRILELIGRGGMGAVYRAEHVLLRELRAVKVIRKESFQVPDAIERFSREARIAVRLRHPNLVLVHDFFIEDGDHFLVMEYVAGDSLGKRIRTGGPLDAVSACEIAIRCCAGLAHAHEMGIVHRDLSPENILLTPTSRGFEPRIIDFGIARAAFAQVDSGGTESDVTLTRIGGFVGKPRYASPEQAGRLRRGEKIDARSDVYTFGLILYEMVTADLPFHSDSEIGYLSLHYSSLPERPTVLRPELGIPLSLERVILRCLEKDRDRRYSSAADLGHALEAVLAEIRAGGPRPGDTQPLPVAGAPPVRPALPADELEYDEVEAPDEGGGSRAVPFLVAGIVIVCVALAALGWVLWRGEESPEVAATAPPIVQPAPAPPALPRPAPQPEATPPAAPAQPAPAPSPPPAPEAAKPAPAREPTATAGPALAPVPAPAAAPAASPTPAVAPAPAPAAELAKPAPTPSPTPKPAPAPVTPAPKPAAKPPPAPKPAPAPPPPVVASVAPLSAAGNERYTMVNLHPDGSKLSTVNYQRGSLIPLCTKVRVDDQSGKAMRFTTLDDGHEYVYVHHGSNRDFGENLAKVFGTTCARDRANGLSALDRQGIREGKALIGMSKDGVILAIGYPPEHKTPSLDGDAWRYWTSRFGQMVVNFQNGHVVSIDE